VNEDLTVATGEPEKCILDPVIEEEESQEKWRQVVEFMRCNPKLMIQMIPGELP